MKHLPPRSRAPWLGLLLALACLGAAPGGLCGEAPETRLPALSGSFQEVARREHPFGSPADLAVQGPLAAVANGDGGLVLVDRRAGRPVGRRITGLPGPDCPGREWVQEFRGRASAVSLAGSFAFVLLQSRGYDITRTKVVRYDVSDPGRPRPAGEFLLHGEAVDLAALDPDTVAVTRRPGGVYPPNREGPLTILSFREEGRVRPVATLPGDREGGRLAWDGSRLYACAGTRLLRVTPDGSLDGAVDLPFPALDVAARDGVAWVAAGDRGVAVVDGRGGDLLLREHLPQAARWLAVAGDRLLAASGTSVTPWDLADPLHPRRLPGREVGFAVGPLAADPRGWGAVEPGKGLLLEGVRVPTAGAVRGPEAVARGAEGTVSALGRRGLEVRRSDGSRAALLGDPVAADVAREGSVAWVADPDRGLLALDLRDPTRPRDLGRVQTPKARAVDVRDGLAAVADGPYGLTLVDIARPEAPRVAARHAEAGAWFSEVRWVGPGRLEVEDLGATRTLALVPAGPPAPPRLRLVGRLPLPMGIPRRVRVSADGRTAWMANDEGWSLVGVDLETLDPVAALPLPGFCRGLALAGERAWAATARPDLLEVDLRDRERPRRGRSIPLGSKALDVEADGDLVAAATETGVALVDPARGRVLLRLPGLKPPLALWSHGGRRLLAGQGGLYEVTDPGAPRRISDVEGPAAGAGDTMAVARGREVAVYRLLPGGADLRGTVSLPAPAARLSLSGSRLYCSGAALTAVDLPSLRVLSSVPAPPGVGTYHGGAPFFSDAAPVGAAGRVAAADLFFGLRVFQGDPLVEIGACPTSGGDYTGLRAEGSRVYAGNNWGGITAVDVTDPARPRRLGGYRGAGCSGPEVDGTRVFLQGNVDRTLRVLDFSDPARPRSLAEFPLPRDGQAGDKRRFGATFPCSREGLLYLPGLARILDLADPARPAVLGESLEAGFEHDSCALATLEGRLHLVLTGEDALRVVDVSNPRRPALVGRLDGQHQGYYFGRALAVAGSVAFLANRHALEAVDLSDPRRPRLLSTLEVFGMPTDVRVVGGIAHVASYYGGLHLVDVADPEHPRLLDRFREGADRDLVCYPSVEADAGRVYLGEYYSGLQVLVRSGTGSVAVRVESTGSNPPDDWSP